MNQRIVVIEDRCNLKKWLGAGGANDDVFSSWHRTHKSIFIIGPESDHWEYLSLTNSLTHSCLVNLIDVTPACEDDNSNLLRLFLLFMLMMRNVLTTVWCRCGG